MEARTINVSVNAPKSYRIDLLQQQLTAYAQQLIAQTQSVKRRKQHYRHEALCGIFNSDATEEQRLQKAVCIKNDSRIFLNTCLSIVWVMN